MHELIKAALLYKKWGFSVVPVTSDKRPPGDWKRYQNCHMEDQIIIRAFAEPAVTGIAIVCGRISGGFEGIDVDDKHDLTGTLFSRFTKRVRVQHPVLAQKLVVAATRNNGHHCYYRSSDVARNAVLARRAATTGELRMYPNWPFRTLMETRSEGGIIIVPPSPGYHFLLHTLRETPLIHPSDRTFLLNCSRSFNLYEDAPCNHSTPTTMIGEEHKVFTDFNRRGDIIPILQSHGWIKGKETAERIYFRRPGDTLHKTSGDFHHIKRLFTVFTTSTIFKAEKGYSPSAVYAYLVCEGDFRKAAKELVALGFGKPYYTL